MFLYSVEVWGFLVFFDPFSYLFFAYPFVYVRCRVFCCSQRDSHSRSVCVRPFMFPHILFLSAPFDIHSRGVFFGIGWYGAPFLLYDVFPSKMWLSVRLLCTYTVFSPIWFPGALFPTWAVLCHVLFVIARRHLCVNLLICFFAFWGYPTFVVHMSLLSVLLHSVVVLDRISAFRSCTRSFPGISWIWKSRFCHIPCYFSLSRVDVVWNGDVYFARAWYCLVLFILLLFVFGWKRGGSWAIWFFRFRVVKCTSPRRIWTCLDFVRMQ